MAHQLYVLQQLLLNQYEERMNTSMDPSDQDATDKIKELRRIAFESDGEVGVSILLFCQGFREVESKNGNVWGCLLNALKSKVILNEIHNVKGN